MARLDELVIVLGTVNTDAYKRVKKEYESRQRDILFRNIAVIPEKRKSIMVAFSIASAIHWFNKKVGNASKM